MIYTVDVDLGHLAEVVLVRFLHCKVTPFFPPLPIPYSLEGSRYAQLRSGELCSCRVEYLHNLFGILLLRRMVSSPHLLMQQ